MTRISTFRERLENGDPLIGTFAKTPSPILMEVLGITELDVCCLDTEHAPFGRIETDGCLSVLRLQDMPSLVRVADDSDREIRNALDAGATGVLIPHVVSADQANRIVQSAHFGEAGRGYAGSTRAAGFTTKPMPDHIRDSAEQTTVIAQIEDLAALEKLDEIVKVPGIQCLFIGRVDLAVAMGEKPDADKVMDTVATICKVCREHNRRVGMFTPRVSEVPDWIAAGANLFLLGSEQSWILQGANQLVAEFKSDLPR